MCACCGDTPAIAASEAAKEVARKTIVLSIANMNCGSCVSKIERNLMGFEDIHSARANLTLKRVTVEIDDDLDDQVLIARLQALSFSAYQIDDPNAMKSTDDRARRLLWAMAVAGFGSANIMLLSVSSWSGAEGATRDLFHMISGFIAVPVVMFSGQPFFQSALSALKNRSVNMDVPISLAVLLSLGMSIFETFNGAKDVYFDAAVMLLFFLLIGRYLDQLMRARARNAVQSLSHYAAKHATELLPDGTLRKVDVGDIEIGMMLRLFPGSRVPADCRIVDGQTDLDRSMVTGESEAIRATIGDTLEGGILNLTGAVDAIVEKPAEQSFLAEVTRLLDAAENGRGHYTSIADRMARIYTPAVHMLALTAFIGWMVWTGGDWHHSLLIAISVLIVTCPCALGLAVPVAHVVAASRLFANGILMRDGSALERLSEIDAVAFDKTGTLTTGMHVIDFGGLLQKDRAVLKALVMRSTHPASVAVADFLGNIAPVIISNFTEHPGLGCEAVYQGKQVRLGRADWVGAAAGSGTCFAIEGEAVVPFTFAETLREGANATIKALHQQGLSSTILSGDGAKAVAVIAQSLHVDGFHAALKPADKLHWIEARKAEDTHAHSHVLVVGDGINDAPMLAAGHVSMAPASASDVGRHAADFIFTRGSLEALTIAHKVAQKANRIVRQNFGLALVYNCIAVPLAVMGYVTPLLAAIAMSASSIVVIGNSLRLAGGAAKPKQVEDKDCPNADLIETPTQAVAA